MAACHVQNVCGRVSRHCHVGVCVHTYIHTALHNPQQLPWSKELSWVWGLVLQGVEGCGAVRTAAAVLASNWPDPQATHLLAATAACHRRKLGPV